MKILQIFGAVVAVHVLAFIFIFASPGCSSTPRNIPTPDATAPSGAAAMPIPAGIAAAPVAIDLGTPPAASSADRAEPTRPGSPNAAAIVPAKPVVEDVAPIGTYTVTRGDSLWSIAKKHHLTVAELAKANGLPTNATLQPGKKLMIPGKPGGPQDLAAAAPKPSEPKPAARSADAVQHVVQSGESLGAIARKYQITTRELAAANNITDPAKIRAGQSLVIPGYKAVGQSSAGKSAPGASTATPAATATESEPASAAAPRFEIAPPPPGQDLDAGLRGASTDVPTIKVEDAKSTPPKG